MSAVDTSLPHDAVSSDQISNRFWPTLLILAFGAFVIGTSEFLIMGILPDVAASLGVSVGASEGGFDHRPGRVWMGCSS